MKYLSQVGARLRRAHTFSALVAVVLISVCAAYAEATNNFSDAEIRGRALTQKILSQWPAANSTNSGMLQIRDGKGSRTNFPVEFTITTSPTNWKSCYASYNSLDTNSWDTCLVVNHDGDSTNSYVYLKYIGLTSFIGLPTTETSSFANSDFWLHDLGLEFFHWPTQKVLKKEIHRSCACTVLESTNPNPTTNGYSRVVSWIDTDSLGVVEAYAYDFKGKKLKNFYPKDIKKVNGQWQVQTLVMENLQTGSKSRIEFDLKK
jgi:hypothetical protein